MAFDLRAEFLDHLLWGASRASQMRNWFRAMRRGDVLPSTAQTISLHSGQRILDARFVPGREGQPVVLFCHGIGDLLSHWVAVQAFFAERGIGSMVFSCSGYGKSTGRVRARHYDEDFLVAYAELLCHVALETPVFVLGYSLGTGIAAHGVGQKLSRTPAGLFLCSGFTSFREAGVVIGAPQWIARCVPDVWDNRNALSKITMPVIVVHSDADDLFPLSMGEELAANSHGVEFIATHGFAHSDPFFKESNGYWSPIVERMLSRDSFK